ncbi:hypothetical protein POVWA2_006840 [Plasmodium ovale wallikeri]|uniref:Uncharacterized protein n=1 Tax=Plasmodium ovale wallikeri TaxID=864142 RepID=A0A1A8YK49_PLAOA|nr:hypothetical protein POVWA2_006840 [Plasmodium ovale wallikeri]
MIKDYHALKAKECTSLSCTYKVFTTHEYACASVYVSTLTRRYGVIKKKKERKRERERWHNERRSSQTECLPKSSSPLPPFHNHPQGFKIAYSPIGRVRISALVSLSAHISCQLPYAHAHAHTYTYTYTYTYTIIYGAHLGMYMFEFTSLTPVCQQNGDKANRKRKK